MKKDFFLEELTVEQEILYDEWRQGKIPYYDLYNIDLDKYTNSGLKHLNLSKKGWELLKIKFFVMKIYEAIELSDPSNNEVEIKNVCCPAFAKLLIQEYPYYFSTMRDTKEIYFYQNGIYQNKGDTIIAQHSEEWLDHFYNMHKKNEIIGFIRDYNYLDRDDFNPDIRYINLANGIYDIITNELIDHSSEYLFLNKLPVEYHSDAKYNDWEKFVQNICKNQGKRRKDIEKTLQQYSGYSLYRSYPYKHYVVLDGSGDNAKTTFLDIILKLIGRKNNTSVPLQDLNNRPFTLSKLYGKLTNISDDLPKKALKYSGVIKQITGNSPIFADIKHHIEGIEFTNYAKPWYACNQLPETYDWTDAFFSRMIQITFLNKYVKKQDHNLVDEVSIFKADPSIIEPFYTKEGLSGILNWMIQGLQDLLKNKKFAYSKPTDEIRDEYIKKTNPIQAFIEDECEITNVDFGIPKDKFYKAILNYCDNYGYDKPNSQHIVTKKMNDLQANIYRRQKTTSSGNVEWCWIGIRCITDTTINEYFGKRTEQQGVLS